MNRDIFISYTLDGEGNVFATRLYMDLEKLGYKVYFSQKEQHTGNFPNTMRIAVESCKDFILIITQACLDNLINNKEVWVREELLTAYASNKNIIPLFMPDVAIPKDINSIPDYLRFLFTINIYKVYDYFGYGYDATLKTITELLVSKSTNANLFFQENAPKSETDNTSSTKSCSCNDDHSYIFISYSHKNSNTVLKIIERLQKDGYRIWYDEGIDPGTEWDDYIAEKIEKSGYLIAFISKEYLESENCRDELNYARDLDKSRLLVFLTEVKLTGGMAMRLNRLQAIHKYAYTSFDDFMSKLESTSALESFKA